MGDRYVCATIFEMKNQADSSRLNFPVSDVSATEENRLKQIVTIKIKKLGDISEEDILKSITKYRKEALENIFKHVCQKTCLEFGLLTNPNNVKQLACIYKKLEKEDFTDSMTFDNEDQIKNNNSITKTKIYKFDIIQNNTRIWDAKSINYNDILNSCNVPESEKNKDERRSLAVFRAKGKQMHFHDEQIFEFIKKCKNLAPPCSLSETGLDRDMEPDSVNINRLSRIYNKLNMEQDETPEEPSLNAELAKIGSIITNLSAVGSAFEETARDDEVTNNRQGIVAFAPEVKNESEVDTIEDCDQYDSLVKESMTSDSNVSPGVDGESKRCKQKKLDGNNSPRKKRTKTSNSEAATVNIFNEIELKSITDEHATLIDQSLNTSHRMSESHVPNGISSEEAERKCIFKISPGPHKLPLTDRFYELLKTVKGEYFTDRNWTEYFVESIKHYNPHCCVAFKRHRIQKENSFGMFFHASGYCKSEECPVEFSIKVHERNDVEAILEFNLNTCEHFTNKKKTPQIRFKQEPKFSGGVSRIMHLKSLKRKSMIKKVPEGKCVFKIHPGPHKFPLTEIWDDLMKAKNGTSSQKKWRDYLLEILRHFNPHGCFELNKHKIKRAGSRHPDLFFTVHGQCRFEACPLKFVITVRDRQDTEGFLIFKRRECEHFINNKNDRLARLNQQLERSNTTALDDLQLDQSGNMSPEMMDMSENNALNGGEPDEKCIFKISPGPHKLPLTDRFYELLKTVKGEYFTDRNWTEYFVESIKHYNPHCCVAFKRHRIQKETKNRNSKQMFFHASGYCRFQGCPFEFYIRVLEKGEAEAILEFKSETCEHFRHEQIARPTRSKRQLEIEKNTAKVSPLFRYLEQYQKVTQEASKMAVN